MKVETSGTGLATILFVVFLILKLTGVISWSWLWVFAPIWMPLGFVVVGTVGAVLLASAVVLYKKRRNK